MHSYYLTINKLPIKYWSQSKDLFYHYTSIVYYDTTWNKNEHGFVHLILVVVLKFMCCPTSTLTDHFASCFDLCKPI